MKQRAMVWAAVVSGVLVVGTLQAQPAFGTAFTYQGHLKNADQPADGTFGMVFELYGQPSGGTRLDTYPDSGMASIAVSRGLFTTTIEFDAACFNGDKRWLAITVNGVTLTPRQELTAVPHALVAREASHADNAGNGAVVGEVKMWAGSIATAHALNRWRVCDGSELSRTQYAALFATIGTAYGAGDGAATFNLPTFINRAPMGAAQDDGGVAKTTVSGSPTQTGGAATCTLTPAQMPAHNHACAVGWDGAGYYTTSDGGYVYALTSEGTSIGYRIIGQAGLGQPVDCVVGWGGGSYWDCPAECEWGFRRHKHYFTVPAHNHGVSIPGHTHSAAVDSAGGGQAHPILDPYFSTVFIIYVGE
jgi:microcystin-dependent protein